MAEAESVGCSRVILTLTAAEGGAALSSPFCSVQSAKLYCMTESTPDALKWKHSLICGIGRPGKSIGS